MNTEVRKITIANYPNLNDRITKECNELGNIGYSLAASFVVNGELMLIFQKKN